MAGEGGGGGGGALVVGHYCHDVLKLSSGREVESLGGSVSYITNILDVLGMESTVVSNVGSDFMYAAATTAHPPSTLLPPAQTTRFYADFTTGDELVLRVSNACAPINPCDIPSDSQFSIALAVGVAGEITPHTLRRMVEVSDVVVADIQALIRTIHPTDGIVGLKKLCETEFDDLIEDISFIKASTMEAAFLDIEEVRRRTCLIVTEGKGGCRVYDRDREFHVAAFEAEEVDPTGAGDSFLAGFSAGIMRRLNVVEAARMGNFFGSITVAHVGLPQFSHHHLLLLQQIRKRDWPEQGALLKRRINTKLSVCQAAAVVQTKGLLLSDSHGKAPKSLLRETLALLLDAADSCVISPWQKLKACEELFSSLLSGVAQICVVRGSQVLRVLLLRLKGLVLMTCAQADTWGNSQGAMFEIVTKIICDIISFGWNKDRASIESFILALAANMLERVDYGEQDTDYLYLRKILLQTFHSTQQRSMVDNGNGQVIEDVHTLHGVPFGDHFQILQQFQSRFMNIFLDGRFQMQLLSAQCIVYDNFSGPE